MQVLILAEGSCLLLQQCAQCWMLKFVAETPTAEPPFLIQRCYVMVEETGLVCIGVAEHWASNAVPGHPAVVSTSDSSRS